MTEIPPLTSRFRPWVPGVAVFAFAGIVLGLGIATERNPSFLVNFAALAFMLAGLFFVAEAFRNIGRLWPWRFWWPAAVGTWVIGLFCAFTQLRP